MEERHPPLGSESAQCGLQLQSFVEGLPHEALDHRFTPWPQGVSPESTCKAFDAGEADAEHFMSVSIQDSDSGIAKNSGDLALLP